MRVIELVFGAVVAGPMPAPVMSSAAVGDAVTLMVISAAEFVMSRCETCSRQLRVALSALFVPESGGVKIEVVVFGASVYPLVLSSVDPLTIGLAPLPYAPNVIGDPLDPLDGATSEVPYHASPRLNKIESPAENVDAFTFAIVCHAAPGDVPALESLPRRRNVISRRSRRKRREHCHQHCKSCEEHAKSGGAGNSRTGFSLSAFDFRGDHAKPTGSSLSYMKPYCTT